MGATRAVRWMMVVVAVLGLAAGAAAAEKGVLSGARPSVPTAAPPVPVVVVDTAGPLDKVSKEEKAAKVAAEIAKIEPLVVRMYNVQDLMLGRDFPYRSRVMPPTSLDSWAEGPRVGGGAAGAGGLFGVAPGAEAYGGTEIGDDRAMESTLTPAVLVELIKRTVPGNWQDEGGEGKIDRVGALLVVTLTEKNQKKVAELLAQFRAARPMLMIEARWVLVEEPKVVKLVPADPKKRSVPQEVTEEALKDAGAVVIYHGQTTCFDRQTVHLATGRGETLVTDMNPVVAEAAVGWSPVQSVVLWGALLEVTPALSPDSKSVTLKLHSVVTEDQAMRHAAISAAVASGKPDKAPDISTVNIDLPAFLLHTFRTSVRAPLDKTFIAAGMTAPKAVDGKVLYLVLHVTASKDAEPEDQGNRQRAAQPEGKVSTQATVPAAAAAKTEPPHSLDFQVVTAEEELGHNIVEGGRHTVVCNGLRARLVENGEPFVIYWINTAPPLPSRIAEGRKYTVWFTGELRAGIMGYQGKCIDAGQIVKIEDK